MKSTVHTTQVEVPETSFDVCFWNKSLVLEFQKQSSSRNINFVDLMYEDLKAVVTLTYHKGINFKDTLVLWASEIYRQK